MFSVGNLLQCVHPFTAQDISKFNKNKKKASKTILNKREIYV